MERFLKTILFIILNFVLLALFTVVLFIYASLTFRSFPWYTSEAWQFLIVTHIVNPIFLVVGVLLVILGFFFPVSKLNRVIPFLSSASAYILYLPTSWGLYFDYFLFAFWVNFILFMLFIFTVPRTLILIRKRIIEIK